MWTLVVTLLFPMPEFDGHRYIGVARPNYATNVTTVHNLPSRDFCSKMAINFVEIQVKSKRFGEIKAEYTCTQEIAS